jgi:peptide/nickel transport system ATP-binding protein
MSRLSTLESLPAAASAAAGGPVASIQDLHVTFARGGREVRAVRGVSLEIAPGEIVGLVGESGSGKSVLGLSLLGLNPESPAPSMSGHAIVGGVDMVTSGAEQRRLVRRSHLGAVFQDPMTSLDPTMTVGKQVAEAAGGGAEALALLDAVGIPDPAGRARSFPHQLSGGLRQRVMIAMAIAGSPELVIADEPTTALDVSVQAQILSLLRRLCDETGTSFLFVTHDLGVAAQLADRIVVMYGGRIAESGPAAEVLEQPVHPYTAALMRSRLTMASDRTRPLVTLPGEPPDPRDHPAGCAFAPRCEFATDECSDSAPPLAPAAAMCDDGVVVVGHAGEVACFHAGETLTRVAEDLPGWGPVSNTLAGYGSPIHPPLRLEGVTKEFTVRRGFRGKSTLHALRGVDLEIEVGEAVALVGESGSGKSTLLRVVAGLLDPEVGTVSLGEGGKPQIVFQDAGASMTPWLDIGDLLEERLLDRGRFDRREAAAEALKVVGLLAEVADAKPRQLSGGQRQRAALARAVVVPPALLLCDEPTSALDVSLAATVLNLIGTLRRELGMAVLFVTHDLAAARLVADRIAVMYLGRIVECGPSEELVTSPRHPYTRALLRAVPEPGAVHVPLPGDPPSAIDPPTGCAFHPRCEFATDICRAEDPLLTSISSDSVPGRTHVSACHHQDEL